MQRPMKEKVIEEFEPEEWSGRQCHMLKYGGKLIAYEPVPFPDGMVEAKKGEKIDKRWKWWNPALSSSDWSATGSSDPGRRYSASIHNFAIRPDYPDPGEGYKLIIAEDMPGDEKIPGGLDCWANHKWLEYGAPGLTWQITSPKYFRRRIVPVEPYEEGDMMVYNFLTFAQETVLPGDMWRHDKNSSWNPCIMVGGKMGNHYSPPIEYGRPKKQEPPTFANDYETQKEAAEAVAKYYLADCDSQSGYLEEFGEGVWECCLGDETLEFLSSLVLGQADMTKLRWKPKA